MMNSGLIQAITSINKSVINRHQILTSFYPLSHNRPMNWATPDGSVPCSLYGWRQNVVWYFDVNGRRSMRPPGCIARSLLRASCLLRLVRPSRTPLKTR